MTILDLEPLFVGRIEQAPPAALEDRILKAIFLLPEGEAFRPSDWRDQIVGVMQQARVREALLHDYYLGFALIQASQEALDRLPILLESGRRYWVLGAAEYFSLKTQPAGNWSDSAAALEAKSVLGAQIYRLEALLLGASGNGGASAGQRRGSIHAFCAGRLRPRLDGLLRATGSRGADGSWESYMAELRDNFGAPALRRLYGAPEGARTRLDIGTLWRREGRALSDEIGDLDAIDPHAPYLRREVELLDFAADLLARTAIADRDGVAKAVREGVLDGENMAAIVDIDSLPDLDLATEAARRWNVNPADYYFRLGAMRGHFDAARALGVHSRTGRVQMPGLASFGLRALIRVEGDDFFEDSFARVRSLLREAMPDSLVEEAEAAERMVPPRPEPRKVNI